MDIKRLLGCVTLIASTITVFFLCFVIMISAEHFNQSHEGNFEGRTDCSPDYEGYCLNGGTCFYLLYEEVSACICPDPYGGKRCQKHRWYSWNHSSDKLIDGQLTRCTVEEYKSSARLTISETWKRKHYVAVKFIQETEEFDSETMSWDYADKYRRKVFSNCLKTKSFHPAIRIYTDHQKYIDW